MSIISVNLKSSSGKHQVSCQWPPNTSLALLLQTQSSNPQLIRLNIIVTVYSTANYRARKLDNLCRRYPLIDNQINESLTCNH